MHKDTQRIEVETKFGTIIVDVSDTDTYKGVLLSFRAKQDEDDSDSSWERKIALLDAESEDGLTLRVWSEEGSAY